MARASSASSGTNSIDHLHFMLTTALKHCSIFEVRLIYLNDHFQVNRQMSLNGDELIDFLMLSLCGICSLGKWHWLFDRIPCIGNIIGLIFSICRWNFGIFDHILATGYPVLKSQRFIDTRLCALWELWMMDSTSYTRRWYDSSCGHWMNDKLIRCWLMQTFCISLQHICEMWAVSCQLY